MQFAHPIIHSARNCLVISHFLIYRNFPRFVILSFMFSCGLSPAFRNSTRLVNILVVSSIHLCLLRAYGGLRDAQQKHHAILTISLRRAQTPFSQIRCRLGAYYKNMAWNMHCYLLHNPATLCTGSHFSYFITIITRHDHTNCISRYCPGNICVFIFAYRNY